ncbi:hypothetical protein [Amphibacillus xylanus]|uniref:Uncharacterized protein n=1 Tax=Amphibacillus xylanus (strain ATCC 51415 / DSM 6626 / JCM 7361 / LMG 17667 / NBRC 15112 / Ep01) TaxID=698758 RepID=K0J7C4_AMPXN|nr:hypothetical protein [Amphibacillus xylanus]BAM47273.1 hypothetical protein AXY_11410 [Amphibacillus xylanus NBRC 15112]
MKKYKVIILSLFLLIVIYYQLSQLTVATIKYFPLNTEAEFSNVSTTLNLIDQDNQIPKLQWKIQSQHQQDSYLDQNVGLLYENGRLIGIQSKWSQSNDPLSQMTELNAEPDSLYQAISYHYLELHQPSQSITSNYQMTTDQLYVIKQDPLQFFHYPKSLKDQTIASNIDDKINQDLNKNWLDLINHYQIDQDSYYAIPFIDLYRFQDEPLPGLNLDDSKRVIAQIWEGLYKNYILPASQQQTQNEIMPLILLAKDGDHLLILFYDHKGDPEQLMQKINMSE